MEEYPEISAFTAELNTYLKARFNYKSDPADVTNFGKTIDTKRGKFELYLRYKPDYDPYSPNTLVIARVFFYKTRRGHGTDLLRFFVSVAPKFGIEHIAVEMAGQNATAFCKAHGFQEIANKVWSVSVEKLKNRAAA
ncbi:MULTISPECIES: hypothetical protein [Pseudoalteromonas]|uniref:N-acetyltransferase domain-containing protein n=1 Tax=Pseudoalteromonas amylolytica TaxID=1859457 RepID=A0A1S1MZW8_9GAMM|nr:MULTISPECIES: hypothetical protein [Pseudoalteromonas]OHU85512.1 hypothetical protein BFC16_19380 [Pseudoalteromonas sp. JW3]OHU91746.1 hypothetical protein BET10_08075 [Pseudoalteromonas amylolytica]